MCVCVWEREREREGVIIERQSEKTGESIGQNSVLISILKPMNVLETKECWRLIAKGFWRDHCWFILVLIFFKNTLQIGTLTNSSPLLGWVTVLAERNWCKVENTEVFTI